MIPRTRPHGMSQASYDRLYEIVYRRENAAAQRAAYEEIVTNVLRLIQLQYVGEQLWDADLQNINLLIGRTVHGWADRCARDRVQIDIASFLWRAEGMRDGTLYFSEQSEELKRLALGEADLDLWRPDPRTLFSYIEMELEAEKRRALNFVRLSDKQPVYIVRNNAGLAAAAKDCTSWTGRTLAFHGNIPDDTALPAVVVFQAISGTEHLNAVFVPYSLLGRQTMDQLDSWYQDQQ